MKWVLWIGQAIIKSKKRVPPTVAREYSQLIKINVFGYTTFSAIAFGAIILSILADKIVYMLICFASVQIKLTGLVWNFQKLKMMAVAKAARNLQQPEKISAVEHHTNPQTIPTEVMSATQLMVK